MTRYLAVFALYLAGIACILPAKSYELPWNPVDDYLCWVYFRIPEKCDSSGCFTWKDFKAADRLNMGVCRYAIGGMHPDLRLILYHWGHLADWSGIEWGILSGFRDDFRQSIASGFKARTGNSLHGGSRATKGYGDGRAVDIWATDSSSLPKLLGHIDTVGARYGLLRPMKSNDPAHVQLFGNWQKIAARLRGSK